MKQHLFSNREPEILIPVVIRADFKCADGNGRYHDGE